MHHDLISRVLHKQLKNHNAADQNAKRRWVEDVAWGNCSNRKVLGLQLETCLFYKWSEAWNLFPLIAKINLDENCCEKSIPGLWVQVFALTCFLSTCALGVWTMKPEHGSPAAPELRVGRPVSEEAPSSPLRLPERPGQWMPVGDTRRRCVWCVTIWQSLTSYIVCLLRQEGRIY